MGEIFTEQQIKEAYQALVGADWKNARVTASNEHNQLIVTFSVSGQFRPEQGGIVAEMLSRNDTGFFDNLFARLGVTQDKNLRTDKVVSVDGNGNLTIALATGERLETDMQVTQEAESKKIEARAEVWKQYVLNAVHKIEDKGEKKVTDQVVKALKEDQAAVTEAYHKAFKTVETSLKDGKNVAVVIYGAEERYLPQSVAAVDAMKQSGREVGVYFSMADQFINMAVSNPIGSNSFFALTHYAGETLPRESLRENAAYPRQEFFTVYRDPQATNSDRKRVSDQYDRDTFALMEKNNLAAGQKVFFVYAEHAAALPEGTVIINASSLSDNKPKQEYLGWRHTIRNENGEMEGPDVERFMKKIIPSEQVLHVPLKDVTPQLPSVMMRMLKDAQDEHAPQKAPQEQGMGSKDENRANLGQLPSPPQFVLSGKDHRHEHSPLL